MTTVATTSKRPNKSQNSALPFLKWAGGKRRLLAQYQAHFPSSYNRYHEPFVGGGACFFHLKPERAVLSDINHRLIDAYTALRDDLDGVISQLEDHRERHCKAHYYTCRDDFNQGASLFQTDRAALMIYLNKTCFNGLYRENLKGGFNVPMGNYKSPKIFNEENLYAVHRRLQNVELHHASFDNVLEHAVEDDLIFFDPPYVPISATSSFTNYNKDGFGAAQQRRLADVFATLSERGCKVMLSNSDCGFVRELYDGWNIKTVMAPRSINSRASGRGAISEVLVRNF